uniref:Uncharacterized protein n=1 Tax=viral metagenome TaxID=1070528 RepID=A0A6M3KKR4_9ZZZZ
MKASELILKLQALIEKHGDMSVFSTCGWDDVGGIDVTLFAGREKPVFELVAYQMEEESHDTETKSSELP